MRARYIAIVSLGPQQSQSLLPRELAGLPTILADAALQCATDDAGVLVRAPYAAVIGPMFDRGSTCRVASLSDSLWEEIIRSEGALLTDRFWGNYVAVFVRGEAVFVVRAPFGDLSCFYARAGDQLMIASDTHLLRKSGAPDFRPHIQAVARQIAWPDWRSNETCLSGLGDLRGGSRLRASGRGVIQEVLWSPWRFTDPKQSIGDREDAVRTLRGAVRLSVSASASECHRAVLMTSGGLDSSIVAACLASSDQDFSCLNLVGDDAASDEVDYARAVAAHLGGDLVVCRLQVGPVDLTRSGAAKLPYPVHRGFTQAQDHLARLYADEIGADAILDGGGGDNVFFATRSVSILADCLLTGGIDERCRATAAALGDLSMASRLLLARKTVARLFRRDRAPRFETQDAFLASDWRRFLATVKRHPWFEPARDTLPGRAAHVALLVPAQNMVEAVNAGASFRSVSPLATQPVVEACLRVPSWHWVAPGRDRAAARAAFQSFLPADVVNRRSKATPTGFVAALYERNRTRIRDLLLGGWLADQRLLDRRRLEMALHATGPVQDLAFAQIMNLVDVEAWARCQL